MTLTAYLQLSREPRETFAKRVGVSPEAVRLWALGKRTPRPAQMVRITTATDGAVTANDFLPRDEGRAA